MKTSMTITGAALAIGLWALAFSAQAATIWTGPKISFSKASGADPSEPANQDRMTPAVWITRGTTMGLFNARTETAFSSGSPAGTEWAYGTTANLPNLTFQPWVQWNGNKPPTSLGREAVLHLIAEDIYIDITFTDWGSVGGRYSYQRSTPASPPPPATTTSYQGLWWASPANSESGWGLNITHQGDILFMTWFTYDTDGSGLWLVMPNGGKVGTNSYRGTLYRTTGPAFDSVPFNGATVVAAEFGDARFDFTDADNGVFTYTVGGVARTKAITRQVYAGPAPICRLGGTAGATPNYQDLWWASPAQSEPGWGLNITHQSEILFVTWFTYAADRKGQWIVMARGERTAPGTYSGALYRTRGPAYNKVPWTGEVSVTPIGSGTFTFAGSANGTFAYTVDGISQSKAITREVFASPVSVCATP